MKEPAVYIMTNKRNGTLYTGVTSDLVGRVHQHKTQCAKGFTQRYDCHLLVYFECCGTMESALLREKQLKQGSRKKKLALIEGMNPTWRDLWPDILP